MEVFGGVWCTDWGKIRPIPSSDFSCVRLWLSRARQVSLIRQAVTNTARLPNHFVEAMAYDGAHRTEPTRCKLPCVGGLDVQRYGIFIATLKMRSRSIRAGQKSQSVSRGIRVLTCPFREAQTVRHLMCGVPHRFF